MKAIQIVILCNILSIFTLAQNEVLTKVNGGASWELAPPPDGNGIYDGNGSLTAGTTEVEMKSNNLLFSSTGGDLTIGSNALFVEGTNGFVAVSDNNPESVFQIDGSLSYHVATFTPTVLLPSYDMDDDYILFINANNTARPTINLPNPADCPGRVYRFIKISTLNAVDFSHSIRVSPTTSQSTFANKTDLNLIIVSDGTDWWELDI